MVLKLNDIFNNMTKSIDSWESKKGINVIYKLNGIKF